MDLRRSISLLFAFSIVLSWGVPVRAQEEGESPSVLLILDSSGSMNASDGAGSTKIAAAKDALTRLVGQMPDDALVGLRVYGHRVPNTDKQRGCRDTELIAPVEPLDRADMKQRIRSFDAKGFTPIGLSLQEGAQDLPAEGKRTIVLVSDGIDTCAPPSPCLVARRISGQGIDLRIDTIGFQVDPKARKQLRCIARVAGGDYADARSSAELADRLSSSSLRALRTFEVRGTPVTGTAEMATAPLLTSGSYTDVISDEEKLWYRVDLAEGQTLSVAASVVSPATEPGSTERVVLGAHLYRSTDLLGGDVKDHRAGEATTVQVATEPIGSKEELLPGPYHFVIQAIADFELEDELPLQIVVEVRGIAGEPTPATSDTVAAPPMTPPNPDDPPGPPRAPIVASVVAALAGIVVGALGAARLSR